MRNKRKFAEEVVAEVAAVAPAADPKETIVASLVEMGLSAEQAEAVYQTAADLVATEPAPAAVAVAASRQEKPIGRREMHRASRGREGRGVRRGDSRREFSRRGETRQGDRREFAERSTQQKTRMSDEDIRSAKMRREVRMLKKQMREMGAAPADGPQRGNPLVKQEFTQPVIPVDGTPATRAFAIMKSFNL